MRRRDAAFGDEYPTELVEFRAEDWPRTACHPECEYWAAVRQWSAEHPGMVLPRPVPRPRAPFHVERI